jgi:hypothetical protein
MRGLSVVLSCVISMPFAPLAEAQAGPKISLVVVEGIAGCARGIGGAGHRSFRAVPPGLRGRALPAGAIRRP